MEDLLLLITVLVTIVGWIFTGSQQLTIVRETRKYQRKDRDLAIFRIRMDKASELTKALVLNGNKWMSLSSLAFAILDLDIKDIQSQEENLLSIYKEVGETRSNIHFIIYDPQYRALRNLLEKRSAEKLDAALKESALQTQSFFSKTMNIDFSNPNIKTDIKYISEEAKNIGYKLIDVTNLFANAFAELDTLLTTD